MGREVDHRPDGQRYASLLSTAGLGYPLWYPSPRRTDTGEEHPINIGDVGICSDMHPFHTLFNITKRSDGINRDQQVSESVSGPKIEIQGLVTVVSDYHQPRKLLARPGSSVLRETSTHRTNARLSTYHLSGKEGSLLMLPQGGVLKQFERTHAFLTRINDYWRRWYKFAENEANLDAGQSLCLVTGVEKCSSWAMAVWHYISNDSHETLDHLVLSASNEPDTSCRWTRYPPRCSTKSSTLNPVPVTTSDAANSDGGLKDTVFIRAFWITRRGEIKKSPPAPGRDRDRRNISNLFRRFESQTNSLKNFKVSFFTMGSFSKASPSTPSPPRSCGRSKGPVAPAFEPLGDFDSNDMPSIVTLSATFNTASYPCQLINNLAFEIIYHVRPSLLDSGFAAFSHDDDWISVLENLDDTPLEGFELLRRVFSKYKLVTEGDIIFTETMTTAELSQVRESIGPEGSRMASIPVMLQFRRADTPHEPAILTEQSPEPLTNYLARLNEALVKLTDHSESSPFPVFEDLCELAQRIAGKLFQQTKDNNQISSWVEKDRTNFLFVEVVFILEVCSRSVLSSYTPHDDRVMEEGITRLRFLVGELGLRKCVV
ncbi:hypothetical protein AAF712_015558 [Marasmius tenuissimus]|uniref:Uncharacterized protein n=1 Tax=Marasmius tenuissimus TaxID=585030 RepID=A0ABR2Z9Y7_9AGAR